MHKLVWLWVISLALVGCGGGGSSAAPEVGGAVGATATVAVEVVHASQDAPAINVVVNGEMMVSDLDFKQAGFVQLADADLTVEVEGQMPAGTESVLGPIDLQAMDGQRVSIIAADELADIGPIVLTEERAEVDASQVRVRVAHAASTMAMVDVYVSAADVDLSDATSMGAVEFGGDLGAMMLDAGEMRVRVASAGDTTNLLFDSGAVTFSGGSDLLLTVVTNTGPGPAPIALVSSTAEEFSLMLDAATAAELRAIHGVSDAPAVDVFADDTVVVAAATFRQASAYQTVAPGINDVRVALAGEQEISVLSQPEELAKGVAYSAFVLGSAAEVEALVVKDDRRGIATEARVRAVHGSTLAGNVDVYLLSPEQILGDVEPTLSNVSFGEASAFLSVEAGDYDVVITVAGDTTPAIGPVAVTLDYGVIYTALAIDGPNLTTPLDVLLLASDAEAIEETRDEEENPNNDGDD